MKVEGCGRDEGLGGRLRHHLRRPVVGVPVDAVELRERERLPDASAELLSNRLDVSQESAMAPWIRPRRFLQPAVPLLPLLARASQHGCDLTAEYSSARAT